MKAVILAAGQGLRLRPYTDNRPKCMVDVGGKPLLQHTLDALQSCGITDISVVCGYHAEKIPSDGIKKYINPRYEETNMVYSLFCAKQEFTDDLFIVYGDILFTHQVLRVLIESKADFSVVVDKAWKSQWELRMGNPLLDAETMKIDRNNNIIELGRKPKDFSEIDGQYIGLIKISKKTLPQIQKFYENLDPNALYFNRPFEKIYMTDFIQLIIDRLMSVKAVFIHKGWFEIDSVRDLEIVSKIIKDL